MQQQWGTRPESLIACISPSLGPCHALFPQWQEQFPPSFAAFRQDGDLFNFWEIGRHQLMACGLTPEHIETANLCTHCHPEPFLSYRRDKTPLRHGTCIALR
jgi:copper oxidase (laccase) domain-containing protein